MFQISTHIARKSLDFTVAKGLVAKKNSQNLFKLMSIEPSQAYCCAISKIFADTLCEMAPNISDIEQKIRTMYKCPKNNNTGL